MDVLLADLSARLTKQTPDTIWQDLWESAARGVFNPPFLHQAIDPPA